MALTIAATRPRMVNSLAATCTGSPNSRRVDEVTGPIDDIRMPLSGEARLFAIFFAPSSLTKFLTVEELVKVTTCGRRAGVLITCCKRLREALGTTVS